MEAVPDKFIQASSHDLEFVMKALRGGKLSGTSGLVAAYEEELAEFFGARHAIAVSSGSTALQAALHIVGAHGGAEVLVPAAAPLPTVFPVTANGALPVAVDIREGSFDFDPDDLAKKITPGTRAAIIVPLWGYPIDLEETRRTLNRAGIPLIEDAAHAHGACWNGRKVGTAAALGCFSTHDRKLLATGEGGFILTDREDLAAAARSYTQLGLLGGEQAGVNFKPNALACALGLARIGALEAQIAIRGAIASKIKLCLQEDAWLSELHMPGNSCPNYYNLVFSINGVAASAARKAMEAINAAGIAIDQIKYGYDVFYRRKVYRHLSASCPVAEEFINRVIQLPVHPNITDEHIGRLVQILHQERP